MCAYYTRADKLLPMVPITNKTNKNLRCGNRKGLLGRNDQTHHRMGPKTMESIPPSKRNTQADIQLRTQQTNHQQETDGCIQIKHNPEHQPSRMSSKSKYKLQITEFPYLDYNITRIKSVLLGPTWPPCRVSQTRPYREKCQGGWHSPMSRWMGRRWGQRHLASTELPFTSFWQYGTIGLTDY